MQPFCQTPDDPAPFLPRAVSFSLRPAVAEDEPFLWECLYRAIYVPPGQARLSRKILQRPEIAGYLEGWGRAGDRGVVAVEERSQARVGAAWLRLLQGAQRGFGYVDDQTPELTIALMPGYRGRGLGTALLQRLLAEARLHHAAVSLSVNRDNPALHLYRRLGFEMVCDCGSSLKMIRRWE